MKTASALAMVLCCLGLVRGALGQDLEFPNVGEDPAALAKAMPELARQALVLYKETDREKYLDDLFRMQIVAERYQDAIGTIGSLRAVLRASRPPRGGWVNAQYELFAQAKLFKGAGPMTFEQAYARAFRDAFARLDDRNSALAIGALTSVDPANAEQALRADLQNRKGRKGISLPDALTLIRDYQEAEFCRSSALNVALVAEDDARRYLTQKDIQVRTPEGATVCALLMRPRAASGPLTTLLEFTIYVDEGNMTDARQTAAHGYAGLVGYTRGKACSPDKPVPYRHDGADAAALIDWVTAQPWSDGRVGMYGGSYNGFAQWAAAKFMPKGLKALMMGSPACPGIDVPMEGNVFWNFVYPWPLYTTNAKGADDATYNDRSRWRRLDHDWYVSGRAYRDLEKIDGTPNPVFAEWLAHPAYDAYWRSMIPDGQEFSRINIPVLQTVGYYFGGPGAAVHYFTEHTKFDPGADHYLVIGPYHHIGAQYGVVGQMGEIYPSLAGLRLDSAAMVDFVDLRYAWFDHIFKGAPKPALLQGRVNYQVVGGNVWKHAPSLEAMANASLTFHLSSTPAGEAYKLIPGKPAGQSSVDLKVDLADRGDVDRVSPGGGVISDAVDPWCGLEFVSDPLPEACEASGLFSGHLEFITNKKDFDFEIDLYERTPVGKFVLLSQYWTRASYAADQGHRRLLRPGRRESLDFKAIRLMSRQMERGSRLVAVLRVIKEPGRQINYGSGKDVSDETVADAGEALTIKWFGESTINLPVWK